MYRFKERSREELVRTFDNSSDLATATVVSDSNRLAVIFTTLHENSTANYRMTYSMLETGRFFFRWYSLTTLYLGTIGGGGRGISGGTHAFLVRVFGEQAEEHHSTVFI